MLDIRLLMKGERLPKHKMKVHSHTDIRYNWYHLLNEDENIIGHYAKPRHRGMRRAIILNKEKNNANQNTL